MERITNADYSVENVYLKPSLILIWLVRSLIPLRPPLGFIGNPKGITPKFDKAIHHTYFSIICMAFDKVIFDELIFYEVIFDEVIFDEVIFDEVIVSH